MAGDLEGLLVVSLEQAVAAPLATRKLADAGARVIKLERAAGDFARGYDAAVQGLSAYFVWLNHGKESVLFDLKAPEDIMLLHRMLARADVFVQNLAPDATARAGIGSAALRARYPALITCDITGYGSSGPRRTMKAYDLLVQAESGLASITGGAGEAGRVGVSVCDIACGMDAHAEILAALYARQRTGTGRALELSLYHSIADWMNVPYLQARYGNSPPKRIGLSHPTIAPYGVYRCARDARLLVAVQNEREWFRFAEQVLGAPGLAADGRFATNVARVANRAALDAAIEAAFAAIERDDLIALLERAEIAYGRIVEIADVAGHPQNRFISVGTPAGPVDLLESPGSSAGRREAFGSVPELGEHSSAVRNEFAVASERA
jgi:crotonobetainyl-CoA:carnitine CoA-transferase CaiB-like acyl-CoA transferase